MASSPTRLNILNHGLVQVEPDNHVAVRDVETFFCYRGSEDTVDFPSLEFDDGSQLLFEGRVRVSAVITPVCSDLPKD